MSLWCLMGCLLVLVTPGLYGRERRHERTWPGGLRWWETTPTLHVIFIKGDVRSATCPSSASIHVRTSWLTHSNTESWKSSNAARACKALFKGLPFRVRQTWK